MATFASTMNLMWLFRCVKAKLLEIFIVNFWIVKVI